MAQTTLKNYTADPMEWNEMINLVHRLYRDGEKNERNYKLSLLIALSSFFLLRISDTLAFRFVDLIEMNVEGKYFVKTEIVVIEQKTKKRRIIPINEQFRVHILNCFYKINGLSVDRLKVVNLERYIFTSQKNSIYKVQSINKIFKTLIKTYNLSIKNFSTHSCRKAGSLFLFNQYSKENNGHMAIVYLMEVLSHSSPAITLTYIGVKRANLTHIFDKMYM
jgi:integrase